MTIELYIEELVLDNMPPGNRYRIATALERGLTQLFSQQGVPSSLTQEGEISNLDGGAFNIAPGAKAETIGAQVAKSVYGSIKK